MKRLALHADIHGLQRIQSHLALLLRRLACYWCWPTSNAHLLELLCCLLHPLLTWRRITCLWRLIPALRLSIWWLSICRLGRLRRLALVVPIAILRLLRHPIRRLLRLRLLCSRVSIARRLWCRSWILSTSRLLTTECRICTCSKLVCLSGISTLLLASCCGSCSSLFLLLVASILSFRVGLIIRIRLLRARHIADEILLDSNESFLALNTLESWAAWKSNLRKD